MAVSVAGEPWPGVVIARVLRENILERHLGLVRNSETKYSQYHCHYHY
jgi:hypothetical protein